MSEITLTPRKNSNNKIVIRKTPNGDSRTKLDDATIEMVHDDVMEHIKDVQKGMNWLAKKIALAGFSHDKTKVIYEDEYVGLVMDDLVDDDFLASDWWSKHIHEERHHLNSNAPVDVNLIDVMEMIVDCVMSGKGRKGHFDSNDLKLIDPVLLERAYWNTVKMLDDQVVVR